MKRGNQIYFLAVIVIIILGLLIYMYMFNIYEVTIKVEPEEVFADNQSVITITAVPLNSFGKKVPFRNVSATFEITEGNKLVTILKKDELNGVLTLKSGNNTGRVEIIVVSEKSLLPTIIEFTIKPNYAVIN